MDSGNHVANDVTLEAFGVGLQITISDERHVSHVRNVLPPGWRPKQEEVEQGHFQLMTGPDELLHVTLDGESLAGPVDLDVAVGVLDAQIRAYVALNAPDHIFVHAGAVGIDDRAVLIPGDSFAGKTSLVAALVAEGALYYSDEYAVLDTDGRLHPYPKPLSLRDETTHATDHSVESLGGRAGTEVLTVGLIAVTQYRHGAEWSPRTCSRGEGALALLSHTVPARTRPEQALEAVRHAASEAVILQGERGEAGDVARSLLAQLRA